MPRTRLICLLALAAFATVGGIAQSRSSSPQPPQKVGSPQPTPRPSSTTSSTQASEDEVIRVDTDLVNTLFTAFDKDHHFLISLRAEDVAVFENDVAQRVSLFERETNRPLSLALLVDTSESQRGVLEDEKNAARAFIDSVIRPDKDRAAVVSFTGVPKVETDSTNDRTRLHRAIQRVRIEMSPENERRLARGDDPLPKHQDPSGYTGIWDAMWTTIETILAKSPEGTRRAIVLLSDGDDTSSSIKRQDVIDFAIKSEVAVYAIGVRDPNFPLGKLDAGALRKVSDRTGGRVFFPRAPAELKSSFAQIDQELRSQYLLGYSPTNKNRDGSYRRIRIEVINPELRKEKPQLLYRQGYYARKN